MAKKRTMDEYDKLLLIVLSKFQRPFRPKEVADLLGVDGRTINSRIYYFFVRLGYVRVVEKDGKRYYEITEAGRELARRLEEEMLGWAMSHSQSSSLLRLLQRSSQHHST